MRVIKYVGLGVFIYAFVCLYFFVLNFAATYVYHSFFPIGGNRTFVHVVAALAGFVMPIMFGIGLGAFRLWSLSKVKGAWSFNWLLFLCTSFPFMMITIPGVLINYLGYHEFISMHTTIKKFFPNSESASTYLDIIPIIAGFTFTYCISKAKENR